MLAEPIPPAPAIFYGRTGVVDDIADAISQQTKRQIAILGPGGIGKSSVALRVLHQDRVLARFGPGQRFFVSCDAARSRQALLENMAAYFGLATSGSLEKKMLTYLGGPKGPFLMVLDNFETPWEDTAARADVEELLETLSALDQLTIVLTMRGVERPQCASWESALTVVLSPLDDAAARETILAISDIPDDDDVERMAALVENMPLGLMLLANLAQSESVSVLLMRWAAEKTSMLARASETRLTSLDISIRISLDSDRIKAVPEARTMLSILSALPNGVADSDFSEVFSALLDPGRARSALIQTALAYDTGAGRIRVLAPIRTFVEAYDPPTSVMLDPALSLYISLAMLAEDVNDLDQSGYSMGRLKHDVGNMHSIFTYALTRRIRTVEVIKGVIALNPMMYAPSLSSLDTLRLAGEVARGENESLYTICRLRLMRTIILAGQQKDAVDPEIVELAEGCRKRGDVFGEANCLYMRSTAATDPQRRYDFMAQTVPMWDDSREGRRMQRLALVSMANICIYFLGRKAEGMKISEKTFKLAEEAGDLRVKAVCYRLRALQALDMCEWAEAEANIGEAAKIYVNSGVFEGGWPQTLPFFAYILAQRCQYEAAAEVSRQAITAFAKLGDIHQATNCKLTYIRTLTDMGELSQARIAAEEALASTRTMKLAYGQAFALWAIGLIEFSEGRMDTASKVLQQSMAISRTGKNGDINDIARSSLGDVMMRKGRPADALFLYITAAAKFQLGKVQLELIPTVRRLGDAFAALGDDRTAANCYFAVTRKAAKFELLRDEAHCHYGLAQVAGRRGLVEEERKQLLSATELYRRSSYEPGINKCAEELKDLDKSSGNQGGNMIVDT